MYISERERDRERELYLVTTELCAVFTVYRGD